MCIRHSGFHSCEENDGRGFVESKTDPFPIWHSLLREETEVLDKKQYTVFTPQCDAHTDTWRTWKIFYEY